MAQLALSELLGAPVYDSTGVLGGRVREVAIAPQEDGLRVASLIIKTPEGSRVLPRAELLGMEGRAVRASQPADRWAEYLNHSEGLLLLERDLLDQQIIDVHGRKVVRVNDIELESEPVNSHIALKISGVDVGTRGAVRRLLQGMVPTVALHALLTRIPPRIIPWEFVDLIETDPSRRVKLKIEHKLLSRLHPADIADIVEELAPADREAVFQTLDEEVAASALEEIDPKLQVSIVESLDSERAAEIVEEMNPDAAADLLADLSAETSEEILEEMAPEERKDVEELLEHPEHTAAGRMTTDFLFFSPHATVQDAIEALRDFSGGAETLNTLYLVNKEEQLIGAVPLSSLVLSPQETELGTLTTDPLISCHEHANDKEVAELFDKYNLLTLPVVDAEGRLAGVITADDVISLLRSMI
jgi:CBS domain-containing protein/sporulation protein YlmC with PRC-barrel domain